MSRIIAFYVSLAAFLLGFGFAGPTGGAPAAVVTGTLGLLGTVGAAMARIGGDTPSSHHYRSQ